MNEQGNLTYLFHPQKISPELATIVKNIRDNIQDNPWLSAIELIEITNEISQEAKELFNIQPEDKYLLALFAREGYRIIERNGRITFVSETILPFPIAGDIFKNPREEIENLHQALDKC